MGPGPRPPFYCVFNLKRTPCHFTDDHITPLHKAGSMCQPSNFRPITLLNSDYKISARVLARRFGMAMQNCTWPEQAASLPGREIGDGIFHSQLVASSLALMQQPGAVVLLDIAKAFDTIDHPFLVAIICRGGMCAWVELLLGNTLAAAVVRGRAAVPQCWYAGVR
jgi:hypothetical protein